MPQPTLTLTIIPPLSASPLTINPTASSMPSEMPSHPPSLAPSNVNVPTFTNSPTLDPTSHKTSNQVHSIPFRQKCLRHLLC
jgi:hypothetical protein